MYFEHKPIVYVCADIFRHLSADVPAHVLTLFQKSESRDGNMFPGLSLRTSAFSFIHVAMEAFLFGRC